ncbi:quinoprotein [Candidatus Kinetoplastibacterium desouzaii TCC079E]|uniref:Quinoprotein n=1 Tax=Candidatus Kinetoplastidibacterium desouzai TCC079E TaxID=1208919 RepID=M1LMI6_9PROT|nr:PQQ-binding-like beta-propeller repeat protein [Candidatus Kinetoplastibacterium desouzaii]AGF46942.1 quinoprotein [Candidatus Kinetoplastibacterium desouzaii TCC079E]
MKKNSSCLYRKNHVLFIIFCLFLSFVSFANNSLEASLSNNLSIKKLWSKKIGKKFNIGLIPCVVDEFIYTASCDGVLVKLELSTGEIVWKKNIDCSSLSAIVASNSIVIVITDHGRILAFDNEGSHKWTSNVIGNVYNQPIIYENIILVKCGNSSINAFDVNTGEKIWSFNDPFNFIASYVYSPMLIKDSYVVTSFSNNKIVSINIYNGALEWEKTISKNLSCIDYNDLFPVIGPLLSYKKNIYFLSDNGYVTCFNEKNQTEELWSKKTLSSNGISIYDGYIYSFDELGNLLKLDANNGDVIWSKSVSKKRLVDKTIPLLKDNYIIFADHDGFLYVTPNNDVSIFTRVKVNRLMLSPIIPTCNGVLLHTMDGRLTFINF